MEFERVIFAVGLTVLAGLGTGMGGLLMFFFRKTNTKLLSIVLGFSAGVMIYISLADLFVQSKELLIANMGETGGNWVALSSFFGGILLISLIDKLIPESNNPHECHKIEDMDSCEMEVKRGKVLRTGMATAIALAIHNFPEGLVTITTALQEPSLGIVIAVAIALHNIPEGISVAIPIYYATANRKKALWITFLSGLTEPIAAIIGLLILMPFLNDVVLGIVLALVAGIMVFVSLDELLPAAREYGEHHLAIYGLVGGMMVTGISIILLI